MLLPLLFPVYQSAPLGLRNFLEAPASYALRCGPVSSPITSLELEGDELVINYIYAGYPGAPEGELRGHYDVSANRFDGIYRSLDGAWSGEINFSFTSSDAALGSWGFGEGTVVIARHQGSPKAT